MGAGNNNVKSTYNSRSFRIFRCKKKHKEQTIHQFNNSTWQLQRDAKNKLYLILISTTNSDIHIEYNRVHNFQKIKN